MSKSRSNISLYLYLRGGFRGAREECVPALFCNHFEELQTVLIEVKLVVNNATLTYVYPNTAKTCLTLSFVFWQTVIILF